MKQQICCLTPFAKSPSIIQLLKWTLKKTSLPINFKQSRTRKQAPASSSLVARQHSTNDVHSRQCKGKLDICSAGKWDGKDTPLREGYNRSLQWERESTEFLCIISSWISQRTFSVSLPLSGWIRTLHFADDRSCHCWSSLVSPSCSHRLAPAPNPQGRATISRNTTCTI